MMKKMIRYKVDENGCPLRIEKEIYSYMDFEWLETDSNGKIPDSMFRKMRKNGRFVKDFFDEDFNVCLLSQKDAIEITEDSIHHKYDFADLDPNTRYRVESEIYIDYHYLIRDNGSTLPDDVFVDEIHEYSYLSHE